MDTKLCKKCGEEKPLDCFNKDKSKKDGLKSNCKSCIKAYKEHNKKRIAEYQKSHYEANKERKAEYRKANKDRRAEYNKAWYMANKERHEEYQKTYRQANKENYAEYRKAYYQTEKGRAVKRAKEAKRRATKLNQTPPDADLELIKQIYERCPEGYDVDHVDPLARGGLHHQDNLCYLPSSENYAKGAKTVDEFGLKRFYLHAIFPDLNKLKQNN